MATFLASLENRISEIDMIRKRMPCTASILVEKAIELRSHKRPSSYLAFLPHDCQLIACLISYRLCCNSRQKTKMIRCSKNTFIAYPILFLCSRIRVAINFKTSPENKQKMIEWWKTEIVSFDSVPLLYAFVCLEV